ncbi:MAG: hypothetical protein R2751_04720 [Bacteroidales bacterium]
MKHTILFLLSGLFCLTSLQAQDKLVLDDRSQLMHPGLEQALGEKLLERGIQYTTTVDYRSRCEYRFAELHLQNDQYFLRVKDCNDALLGSKNLGGQLAGLETAEQAFLLAYNLQEILAQPGIYTDGEENRPATVPDMERDGTPTTELAPVPPGQNEHETRYFFAPSAYNLKEGELYYNTVYFFLHDIQYGLSDHFSLGLGTSLIGLPIYLTPKVSIPLGEKTTVALGDVLMFGTYGTNAMGNLAYGSISRRSATGNVSLGLGHLYTNESDLTQQTSSLVFNLSGMAKASPWIYLLTENYFFTLNTRQTAWWENPVTFEYFSEDYAQRVAIWYGIVGFRILSKRTDLVAWQIGLTYIAGFTGDPPSAYANWQTSSSNDMELMAFPAICYTRKFSRKY